MTGALIKAGYKDATVTAVGPDGGVDIRSIGLIAQVKMQAVPVGAPAVQALAGIAAAEEVSAVFFSASGFTPPAIAFAERAGVGLATFDRYGVVTPLNSAARSTMAGQHVLEIVDSPVATQLRQMLHDAAANRSWLGVWMQRSVAQSREVVHLALRPGSLGELDDLIPARRVGAAALLWEVTRSPHREPRLRVSGLAAQRDAQWSADAPPEAENLRFLSRFPRYRPFDDVDAMVGGVVDLLGDWVRELAVVLTSPTATRDVQPIEWYPRRSPGGWSLHDSVCAGGIPFGFAEWAFADAVSTVYAGGDSGG